MAAPFYNAIKGTTSGTPGTGSFTPNAASAGFLAWSTVVTGWIGLVRYEDGSAWELRYGYWNGTTVSRPTNGFVASSSGSGLTLTSSATAAMVVDAAEVQPHLAGRVAWWNPVPGSTTVSASGLGSVSTLGTATSASLATTNFLTEQPRVQYDSATTADARCGVHNSTVSHAINSTTAGRGGFEFSCRFGASQLPTGPRLFAGLSGAIFGSSEPSDVLGHLAIFGKDSTDTNIQLMTNDGGSPAGKSDTGIPWVANGWYEGTIWAPSGGGSVSGLLIRIDTGDIWFGTRTTDLPVTGALMAPQIVGALNGTNTGTALQFQFGGMTIRTGG